MRILKFKKIDSTNKKAKELAKEGFEPWTVILAKEQTGGYGRKGNLWHSPKGGLYFSVILPKLKIEDLEVLTNLAAFIVAKILKENFEIEPFIKLPNDVYLEGKKVCGILVENVILGGEIKNSVIGIGLNTNIEKFPKDLEKLATSIRIELGKKVNNQKILNKILNELKEKIKAISQ
jgi:BirA family biotin operon repressor/biotin-[acetyl-CoA-carboxylase] ligase